jgi:hypothetical protein
MGPVLDRLFVAAVLGGLLAWVVWGWRSWLRARPVDSTLGLMCSLAVGLISALIGSLSSLFGMGEKSPLRWKAPAMSLVLLLFWFGQALSE